MLHQNFLKSYSQREKKIPKQQDNTHWQWHLSQRPWYHLLTGQPVWECRTSLFWTGGCGRLSLPCWEKERDSAIRKKTPVLFFSTGETEWWHYGSWKPAGCASFACAHPNINTFRYTQRSTEIKHTGCVTNKHHEKVKPQMQEEEQKQKQIYDEVLTGHSEGFGNTASHKVSLPHRGVITPVAVAF